MMVLDIWDTYLSVPGKVEHRLHLKFTLQGQLYVFQPLPFGYTKAPHIFTKLLKPLITRLTSFDITVTFYLDNPRQASENFITNFIFRHVIQQSDCSWHVTSCQT